MRELDVVRLVKDYKNISAGTEGTIVLKYNDKDYEVEFFDSNGNTIDVVIISKEYIELVKSV